ncbi:MAG: hypothetical protein GEU97_11100 [Actinophytocola sp.]|nr:hypothetical protein [Actinophytocola sp.]
MTKFRFALLGPLTIDHGDVPVRLAGRRQQIVLAVLLLDAGRVVPPERLVDAVWPDDPPRTAREQVQTAVWRIRQALGAPGSPDVLVTTPAGYQVDVDRTSVDVFRLDELRKHAATLADCGRPEPAAQLLEEAMRLYRGRPLTGLNSAPALRATADLLDEQRLCVLEKWTTLLLAADRPSEAAVALAAAAVEQPLRESLIALLMLAEYRCGRQAAALLAYERLRRALRDQFGVEPGPAVREAHRRILAHDPALTPARPVA